MSGVIPSLERWIHLAHPAVRAAGCLPLSWVRAPELRNLGTPLEFSGVGGLAKIFTSFFIKKKISIKSLFSDLSVMFKLMSPYVYT